MWPYPVHIYLFFLVDNSTAWKMKAKQKPFPIRESRYRKHKCPCQVKERKRSATFVDRRHLFWKLLNSRVEIFILNTFRYSRFHLTQTFMICYSSTFFCTNKNTHTITNDVHLRTWTLISSTWNCLGWKNFPCSGYLCLIFFKPNHSDDPIKLPFWCIGYYFAFFPSFWKGHKQQESFLSMKCISPYQAPKNFFLAICEIFLNGWISGP